MRELFEKGVTMTYTGVFSGKNGKVVHVCFERRKGNVLDSAEAVIPECSFINAKGFSEKEKGTLQSYLKQNKDEIFEKARKINKEVIFKL